MSTQDLKSIHTHSFSILKNIIENKSSISIEALQEMERVFTANPELLFYSPSHENMNQVNHTRLEVDSIAYLIFSHNRFLGYEGENIPDSFLSFLKTILPPILENKELFDNYLSFFLGKENPLVSDHARHHVQKTNLAAYKQITKSIMLSSHFTQTHMEEIFLQTLSKQEAYEKDASLYSIFQDHDYAAHTIFMMQLGVRFEENEKFKKLLNDLLLSPINKKLIKTNCAASLLLFLSSKTSVESFKTICLSFIKEIAPHINLLDGSGTSFSYYINKHIKQTEKNEYVSSVLTDFGAISVHPSITNKFMETVMSFCKILTVSKPRPVAPTPATLPAQAPQDTKKLITQLDFSKFTSAPEEQEKLKLRLQKINSISEQLLNPLTAKALDINDVFFIKKDVLDIFLVSTFDLTKSLSSFTSIGPDDTKTIFEPWLEQLGIIELRLEAINTQIKDNFIERQTKAAQVNLKVLKAKA